MLIINLYIIKSFTEELIKEIKKKGINFERITLNINLGTFSPLRNEKVEENSLHSEQCYISEATTKKLNEAKADKKQRIICIWGLSNRG